jgi:radical SAM protein with 4Fe4S-binding SPASM domain
MSAMVPPKNGLQLLRALADKRGVPSGVHLQVADRCNHTCQHCYQVQGEKGEMSLDEVKGVLDDLAAQGVLQLSVSGGEATLRRDLLDILRYARSKRFAIRLYTNAFLVDEAMADGLAAVGLYEVHVSVYSDIEDEHDAVTRVPGSHRRTLAGVRAMRARSMRVVLKCPATSLAPAGAAGVERIAKELGCSFAPGSDITPMENGSLEPLRVAQPFEALVRAGIITPWVPSENDAKRRESKLRGPSCGVGRSSVVVLPNGDVLPCTDTPRAVGNLTRDTLRDVLERPDLSLFRTLTTADVHGCRDCDLLPACERCHATALHEAGDYLGPYPTGCARARARYAAGVGALTVRAPAEGCASDRNPQMGPYRIETEGVLIPVADVRTERDEELANQHPWLRREGGVKVEATPLIPVSGLVRKRDRDATV